MLAVLLLGLLVCASQAFVPGNNSNCRRVVVSSTTILGESNNKNGFFQGVSNFFQELDNFMDDASARRLGNGAAFYGKRKSNFYGKSDKNKKQDSNMPDPTEDYQAPNAGGYFQWMPDENGQMRPVTRMKKKVVERNMNYWDKVFDEEE